MAHRKMNTSVINNWLTRQDSSLFCFNFTIIIGHYFSGVYRHTNLHSSIALQYLLRNLIFRRPFDFRLLRFLPLQLCLFCVATICLLPGFGLIQCHSCCCDRRIADRMAQLHITYIAFYLRYSSVGLQQFNIAKSECGVRHISYWE